MRVTVLASGSKGNASLIESDSTRLIIDAGISPRAVRRRLKLVHRRPPNSVDAVIVTHAHGDHARHAAALARSFQARLYATSRTVAAWTLDTEAQLVTFPRHGTLSIGDLEISVFPTPHDSPQVALIIDSGREKLGLATDLGSVPQRLVANLRACQTVLLESNHDVEILRNGPYPDFLKERVASSRGHLSNAQCAALLQQLSVGLHTVVLMHLSETNNQPDLALKTAQCALRGRSVRIFTAKQGSPLQPLNTIRNAA